MDDKNDLLDVEEVCILNLFSRFGCVISGRGGGYDLTAMNEAAMQTAMDGRVPCANCGRKFNPDRVAIHERSCRPKGQ